MSYKTNERDGLLLEANVQQSEVTALYENCSKTIGKWLCTSTWSSPQDLSSFLSLSLTRFVSLRACVLTKSISLYSVGTSLLLSWWPCG